MEKNLLDFYITVLREINQNYKQFPTKRFYRLLRLTNVVRFYIQHTTEFKAEHKGILLDVIQEYYCYALNNNL